MKLQLKVAALLCLSLVATFALAGGYPLSIQPVRNSDGTWDMVAKNDGRAVVYLGVVLRNESNANLDEANKFDGKYLEPGATEKLFSVRPKDENMPLKFDYVVNWGFGRPSKGVLPEAFYRPPFPSDLTFYVLSGNDHPHTSQAEKRALDFMMPEGTPVIASRSGVVFDVRGQTGGDEVRAGLTPSYIQDAEEQGNYVRILHDDGTWAEYTHLAPDSVKVRLGEQVSAGSEIALSGRSGKVTEPMLHFAVVAPGIPRLGPSSVDVKIDLGPRGIVTPVMGRPIGAEPTTANMPNPIAKKDPLLIGAAAQSGAQKTTGVYSTALGKKLGAWTVAECIALTALLATSIGAAIIGCRVALRKRRMKARKRGEIEAAAGGQGSSATSTRAGACISSLATSRMPAPGFLIADHETTFYASLALALPAGTTAHAKVSLARLMGETSHPQPRELEPDDDSSIDFAVTRNSDGRIVLAIDLVRPDRAPDSKAAGSSAKGERLKALGIPYVTMSETMGVESIRQRLSTGGLRARAARLIAWGTASAA